ncbi:MAG: hypothetical protein RLZZ579_656 [Actinomycetota bacterium]
MIVSSLAKLATVFELEVCECSEPARYLYVTGLGIYRQMIDVSGEPILRISQVERALSNSDSNFKELQRQIRLLSGHAHIDIINNYRSEDRGIVSLAV